MKTLNSPARALLALSVVLSACGQQLVQFGKPDAGKVDGAATDTPARDVPTGDLSMVADVSIPDALATDSPPIDARADAPAADTLTDAPVDARVDLSVDVAADLPAIDAPADLPAIDVPADLPPSDVPADLPAIDLSLDLPAIDLSLDLSLPDLPGLDLPNRDVVFAELALTDLAGLNDLNPACRQSAVMMRSAGDFTVLAGSTVTNAGLTTVTGDLGVSPGTAVTGFGPGVVTGAQHAGDPTADQAQLDLTTAYDDAAGRVLCPIIIAGNLGGLTLPPGLYKSTSSLEISSGDLVLDGFNDPNAVFVFQMASTLTTTPGRQVMLIRGARAANVFWQVGSSATLGTTSVMFGIIMADQAITMNTGATLTGRLLARTAAVALDANIIGPPPP